MMENKDILNEELSEEESTLEEKLRPRMMKEFIGQDAVKENLLITIQAAKKRGEPIDHVLFYGPPGLGKTTLAAIIANESKKSIKITSGAAIERAGDLAALLTNLEQGDVLFIDEIHRLPRSVEEVLYPAMEEFMLDIMIGKGPSAKSLRLELPKFTLIGATTRAARLSSPLRDRFGLIHRLDYYDRKDIERIVLRSAKILAVPLDKGAEEEIAKRSRRTPRVANRLLKRARDYAEVKLQGTLGPEGVNQALDALGIDAVGLDKLDREILTSIIDKFKGGPVGVETLAAVVHEDRDTLEDLYEPYLMQLGMLERTPRGRVVTEMGYRHLEKPYNQRLL